MKKDSFLKRDLLILFFILIIALSFRVYKISTPLADLHSWRQVDTASVARNFTRDGFNLTLPKYDDLSNVQTGIENPKGYRFVEFPIYNAMFAFTYNLIPSTPLEIHGRLVSIFFSLIIIAILYYIVFKEQGRIAAVIASSIYAIFPFFVFFSRVILPETTALGFVFISIFFLYLWKDSKNIKKWPFFFLSLIFFSMSILVKPFTIFYGTALLCLFIIRYNFTIIKRIDFYIYFILSIIPFILWRVHMLQFPEGIPASEWLITTINTSEGLKNILFRPAFFRWIFFERINNLILGGFLTSFFVIGLIKKRASLFLYSIGLSALLFLLIFQGGNVQHEYYQTLILPAIAIFTALGTTFIIKNKKIFIHPLFTYPVIICIFAFSFFISFYKVKDFYNYPSELTQMAKIVSSLTNKEDKIVTDRIGDTTFLYLIDRKGAPAVFKSLDELKKDGYDYFVTMNREVIDENKEIYEIVFENDKFALFKL